MNLAHLLRRAAAGDRARPAIALGRRRLIGYGELARRVAVLAGALRDRFGLEPDARVALTMTNTPAFLEGLFAAWHGGYAAVPINAKLHPLEMRYILEHSGAALCLATPDLAEALAPHLSGLDGFKALIDVGTPARPGGDYRRLLEGEAEPVTTE